MLAYCDYIADRVRTWFKNDVLVGSEYIKFVGNVKMDLHPTEGYFMSTKKTIEVIDINNKKYRITVEEI
jgi:hypothetical protein